MNDLFRFSLMVTNSFSFSPWECLDILFYLKNIFTECRIFWSLSSFLLMLQKCWATSFWPPWFLMRNLTPFKLFLLYLLVGITSLSLFFLSLAFRSWLGSILACISLGLSCLGFNSFLNLWVNIFCQVRNTFSHYFAELFFSLTLLPFSGKTRYDLTYTLHFFFFQFISFM